MKPPLTTEARKLIDQIEWAADFLIESDSKALLKGECKMLAHAFRELETTNQVLTEALEEAKNYFQVNGYAPETPILVKIVEALK